MKSTSTKNNPAGLFRIWKEAFEEKDDYIALFFKEASPLGNTLSCGPVHAPYAALTLFPINLELAGMSYSGYYLYALGVLDTHRGKGYGRLLLEQARSYALSNQGAFILLQPTNAPLFAYYRNLGYAHSVSRAQLSIDRTALKNGDSSLLNLLQALSAPAPSRFIWPESMRSYIRKECMYRKGALIAQTAYCYPRQDELGFFVEIKEFNGSAQQIPLLLSGLQEHFPDAYRFVFYGKAQSPPLASLQQAPFALLHFIDSHAEKLYYLNQPASFALGMD
ncbi:MAG: GNAT family N-acetyltransferase [Bacteroidales bacterium]|nr:GNAT family N-acetyltransferase [Bacteroidales bacterium]